MGVGALNLNPLCLHWRCARYVPSIAYWFIFSSFVFSSIKSVLSVQLSLSWSIYTQFCSYESLYIEIYIFVISTDTLIVAVAPKPPVNHLLDDDVEDKEEDELVQFSCSTCKSFVMLDIFVFFIKVHLSFHFFRSSEYHKRQPCGRGNFLCFFETNWDCLVMCMHGAHLFSGKMKWHCAECNTYSTSSDIILMALFSLSMKAWIIIAMWFLLAPIAQKYDIGPLYVSNFFSYQKL